MRVPKRATERPSDQMLEEERLILAATELIEELLEREGVTRTELAERLGKSKGHVSQLLSGERNVTLRTLAELAYHLGSRIELSDALRAAAPRVEERVRHVVVDCGNLHRSSVWNTGGGAVLSRSGHLRCLHGGLSHPGGGQGAAGAVRWKTQSVDDLAVAQG